MAASPSRMWCFPAVEPGGEHDSDVVVVLAELAEEVGDRAAPLPVALDLEGDEGVGPAHQSVPGAEAGEQVLLAVEHDVVGGLGHRFEQVVLVVEVVVELAARRRRPGADLVQARPPMPLSRPRPRRAAATIR